MTSSPSLHFLCILLAASAIPVPLAAQDITFQRDIRPLLAANCFACHGPDEEAREADLRLDTRHGAVEEQGAIIPGNPDDSPLVERLKESDPDLRMPPPDAGDALSKEQIASIQAWIKSGAEYTAHWAFVPPSKPDQPQVSDPSWPASPIDAFVMAQWDARGLQPASPADRYALIRRLSLDLTGLPPGVEEVDAFVNDTAPDAYEKVVQRLLESERFGEHWARMWLDLARYADTKGYEKDQAREMWRYRDWVIDAINRDLPFDQFTVEQLAGDQLSEPTPQQILATAFHRNTMTNDEGGTDDEEFRVLAVKDRVDTTMQVWMGLTMGCAKCHSHKYDPITQDEYYRFYAFFNQTADADRFDDGPRVPTPTADQLEQQLALATQIKTVQQRYLAESDELKAAREAWIVEQANRNVWKILNARSASTQSEARLEVQADGSLLAQGPAADVDIYEVEFELPAGEYTAIRLEAMTDPSLEKGGPGRNGSDPNFVLSEIELQSSGSGDPQVLQINQAAADFSQANWQVEKAFDGDTATGWAISPQQGKPHVAVFRLAQPLPAVAGQTLRVRLSQQYGNRLILGKFRVSVAAGTDEQLAPRLNDLADLAKIPAAERTDQQQSELAEAFRRQWPETAKIYAELESLRQQQSALNAAIPQTPIMRELPVGQQRETRVHIRGNFLESGDLVTPALPEAFGSLPENSPANRLGVAQWLVAPGNPLTARVAVNRIWARLFGRGLVETEEDFGAQGVLPSHPQLLDWLAVTYRDDLEWSLKQLLKTIVMSRTYQLSVVASPESIALDPENRWLSRSPRFRLPAETLRDQALQAAGLLSDKIGGPSVMPPQPDGIWQTTYSTLKWETSPGEDRHRRAIYTFWRRTSPYPSMLTFDAGSREVCVIRRVRTNTPLQALVTLNDPVFVEAAAALAREMATHSQQRDEQIGFGFRSVLCRPPSKNEVARLAQLLDQATEDLATHPADANELLKAGNVTATDEGDAVSLAALMLLGNVILNLDEALMRN